MSGQVKLVFAASDLDQARSIAGILGEVFEPLAVTVFEAGFPAHRVEIYFESGEAPPTTAVVDVLSSMDLDAKPIIEPVPDENWVSVSQAALPPVEAGRFVVFGSHDAARIGRRAGGLLIDAGEAFGTAHHATTLGCLLALDRMAGHANPRRVLDLGCGSGVLAIAAARVFPRATVLASDIDPIATEVARANARANGAGDRVGVVTSTGLSHPRLRQAAPYDLVLANILAGPLMALAPDLRRALRPGGTAVLSGLLPEQAASVVATYLSHGFRLVRRRDLTGWTVLEIRRAP